MGRDDCKVNVTSVGSQDKSVNAEHLSTWRRKTEQDRTAQVESDEACNRSSSESGVYSTQQLHSSGSRLPPVFPSSTSTPPPSSALAMSSTGSGTSESLSEATKDQPCTDYITGRSTGHGNMSNEPHDRSPPQPSCSSLPQPHSTTLLSSTVHSSILPSCSNLATADSDSSTGPLESLVEKNSRSGPTLVGRVSTEHENLIVMTVSERADSATEKSNDRLLPAEESRNGLSSHESNHTTATEDVLCSGRAVEDTASSAELGTSVCDELLLIGVTQSGEPHDPEGNNAYKTVDHSQSEKSCLSVEEFVTHVQDTPNEAVATPLPCKEHVPFIPHSISETLKKAQHSTESLQTSVHSGWSTTSKELNNAISAMSCDTPNVSGIELIRREPSLPQGESTLDLHPVTEEEDSASHRARVLNATQQVEHCVSSLVFIPRGLSQGPCPLPGPVVGVGRTSSPTSLTASTPDLAPDLEMDLYGISYSLDS